MTCLIFVGRISHKDMDVKLKGSEGVVKVPNIPSKVEIKAKKQ